MDRNYDEFDKIKKSKIEVEATECSKEIEPLNMVQVPDEGKKRSKMRRFLWVFATLVLLLIIFFTTLVFSVGKTGFNFQGFIKRNNSGQSSEISEDVQQTIVPPPVKREGALSADEIYKKVSRAVVGVIALDDENVLGSNVAQGTGFAFTRDGYILTNSHVIGNKMNSKVKVIVSDEAEEEEYDAKIIGFDAAKDVAVLKIDLGDKEKKSEEKELIFAELGDSDKINVGEQILAIGNPGGMELSKTMTSGIISAKKRNLGKKSKDAVKFIQFDAAVNHGNSGGPLLNMTGQVIGIVSRKIGDIDKTWEGLGFAIPINTVREVANNIMNGSYSKGNVKLGITARTVSRWESQVHDVPPGTLIIQISENSSLKGSDIKKGDIIIKINDTKILDTETLKEELSLHKPGDVVSITVFRPSASWKSTESGTTFTTKITLIEDK